MHGTLKKKQDRIRVKPQSPEQGKLLLRYLHARAREDFWTYRQLIRPNFIQGWWAHQCSMALQDFYNAFRQGRRPKMILMSPPQHGKTMMVTDFISWISGDNPDLKSMYTSYSDDLGLRANTDLQRIYLSNVYKQIFAKTRVNETKGSGLPYKLNSDLIEYIDALGSFRNTTVQGQITGMGLDFGFVDDPIKGRKEANSKLIRDNTWGWLTDDFFSRFSDKAAMLLIMTRWHLDDPAGRFLDKFKGEVKIIKFPAIASKDEEFRRKGEALFPEHKSLSFLLERKGLLTQGSWEAIYQQNPIIVGGGIFPIEKFKMCQPPTKSEIVSTVRYWDKAATEDGGAYSCGVRMHKMRDNNYIISDVRRGQWSASEREKRIKQTCENDAASYASVKTWVEQEPGSGGKESAENTIKMLAGYRVSADKVTGSKEDRAEPYAAQVQQANVGLVAGCPWVQPFLDEHEAWPNDKFKDQVDAAAGSFMKLAIGYGYDTSMKWVTGS